MKNEPFVIERTLNAPANRVWEALTDKEKMKKWYFDLKEFKADPGFEFQFSAGEEGKEYLHICKVLEVIQGKKLKHSWRYDGYEGDSFVTWNLHEQGDKTVVKLSHDGLETFPTSNPDLAKENFAAGWTEIVGKSLREFVEN